MLLFTLLNKLIQLKTSVDSWIKYILYNEGFNIQSKCFEEKEKLTIYFKI